MAAYTAGRTGTSRAPASNTGIADFVSSYTFDTGSSSSLSDLDSNTLRCLVGSVPGALTTPGAQFIR